MEVDEEVAEQARPQEVAVVEAAEAVAEPEPANKKARKQTVFIFVEPVPGKQNYHYCLLGCLSADHKSRFSYSCTSTDHPRRHVEAKHPEIAKKFQLCQQGNSNWNELLKMIEDLNKKSLGTLERLNKNTLKYYAKIESGLAPRVRSELILVAWATANGIAKSSLNDPLFDMYLNSVGANATSNRHDLQSQYMEALNGLVVKLMVKTLEEIPSVSISHDGWKDLAKRNWIDLAVQYMTGKGTDVWNIEVFDLDIIPLPASSTGDNLETLLRESLDAFLPETCLVASSTCDGGADEQLAASQLVKEGNTIHCNGHKPQLAVHDCLDPKKAHPPLSCKPHRDLIQKAHDLVVFINGHRDILQAFRSGAATLRANSDLQWTILILDNDTRWDTWLMLLERIVHFDSVIRLIQANPLLEFPADLLFNDEEFALAGAMVLILSPIREFTKFVQLRNKVTLAYVPEKIDSLITKLSPGSFSKAMIATTQRVRDLAEALQLELVKSFKSRYQSMYEAGSLALAASSFLPGPGRLSFSNFNITAQIKESLIENLVDDFMGLLPSDTPAEELAIMRQNAKGVIGLAHLRLARHPNDKDPLILWPTLKDLGLIVDLVMMLFTMPASSADNERAFSSAGFTLDNRRYRMDIETFRQEHRLRRYLVSGTDIHTQAGRQARIDKLVGLLDLYDQMVNRPIAQEPAQ